MDGGEFLYEAKKIISHKATSLVSNLHRFKPDDVRPVWISKTLQNNKGMCIVSDDKLDGLYFELTYDGHKRRFYLDTYRKIENNVIALEDVD